SSGSRWRPPRAPWAATKATSPRTSPKTSRPTRDGRGLVPADRRFAGTGGARFAGPDCHLNVTSRGEACRIRWGVAAPDPRARRSGGGPRPWRPRPVATGERVVTLGIRACGAVPVLLSAGLLVILGQGAWSAAEGLAMPPGGLWPRVLGTLLVAGLAGLLAI